MKMTIKKEMENKKTFDLNKSFGTNTSRVKYSMAIINRNENKSTHNTVFLASSELN